MVLQLFLRDFTVFATHPADLRANHYCMPAVNRGSNPGQLSSVLNGGDTGIVGAVSHPDIYRAAIAHNGDHLCLCKRIISIGLFNCGWLFWCSKGLLISEGMLLLSRVIIGYSAHQRCMSQITVKSVLLQ